MKLIIVLVVLLGLLTYSLCIASATPSDRETHEAYERWKEERKKNEGRSD